MKRPDEAHRQYKSADTTSLIPQRLYKYSAFSVTTHIAVVVVLEQKGVESDQQRTDQTAFQPVVHLYFTSVRLLRQPTPLVSYTTAFTSPAFTNKYTTAYTVISGVCLQLVHFHSPALSRGKRTGESGKKERRVETMGREKGAIGK